MSVRYEFRFRGRLPSPARAELRELELEDRPELAETVMVGEVEDSAALNGLLRRFELLGIDVIDVHRAPGSRLRPDAGDDQVNRPS